VHLLYYIIVTCFGLIFGSFFNVAIYRLPRHMSLGHRSQCPSCDEMIHWYDNIPVLSFLVLRARCRKCGLHISWQYPLVEVSTAVLFALTYWWSTSVVPGILSIPGGKPLQPELFIGLVLVSVLIVVTGTDITDGIIPNSAILTGLVIMVPLVVALGLYRHQPGRIGISVACALAGSAFFLSAGLIYGSLFMTPQEPEPVIVTVVAGDEPDGTEARVDAPGGSDAVGADEDTEEPLMTGVGMGDVKLMFFTGLALGYFHWYFPFIQVFFAALAGTLVAVPLLIFTEKGRKDPIPFGPFLAAGAIVALLWGQAIADLYIKLSR
jgi:leader peptidase (prepilin peptidase) / N-methyltransferase